LPPPLGSEAEAAVVNDCPVGSQSRSLTEPQRERWRADASRKGGDRLPLPPLSKGLVKGGWRRRRRGDSRPEQTHTPPHRLRRSFLAARSVTVRFRQPAGKALHCSRGPSGRIRRRSNCTKSGGCFSANRRFFRFCKNAPVFFVIFRGLLRLYLQKIPWGAYPLRDPNTKERDV